MKCPYCGYDKAEAEFTEEHVRPRALGGSVQPTNPVLVKVCGGCNSACGRWIDGPFSRGWLLHNARSIAATEYVDPTRDPVLPLHFMGESVAWSGQDTVCDFWIGPTGDHIYHFHRPYPVENLSSSAGPPTNLKDSDYDDGVVFLAFVGTNPEWHPIVHRSVVSCFKNASLYMLNGAPAGHTPPYPPVPEEHAAKVEWIQGLGDGFRALNMSLDMDYGDRFMTKTALGFGALLLGDAFVNSPDADTLRSALWTRDVKDREKIAVYGSGFLGEHSDQLIYAFSWEAGCHTIVVTPDDASLNLLLCLYGRLAGGVRICSDKKLWQGVVPSGGKIWVVVPGLRRFAGPITLEDFVVEKTTAAEKKASAPPFDQLRAHLAAAKKLPPFHLPKAGAAS